MTYRVCWLGGVEELEDTLNEMEELGYEFVGTTQMYGMTKTGVIFKLIEKGIRG